MSRDAWLALLVSVLLAGALWAGIARPRALALEWQGPLQSISFAPFRDGQSPLREVFPTPQQIEEDLLRLKGVADGIRTYSVIGSLKTVPALAAKHGFALTEGAWLGRDAEDNAHEIATLIETANRYPQAVRRVIVGNEVLLRGDLTPARLIETIDRVRSAIGQPVSYADVWAYWLKHPQLADHVDFITIHILPYWEDEPVAASDAGAHLVKIIDRIREAFPGKPILVGETGWPTEGRSRGPAQPSTLAAARFVRALPALAARHGFDYNLVEAFDQTWKARLEGTVGARWGLFDAQRRHKYALTGPVWPQPNAGLRAVAAIALGVAFALVLLPRAGDRAAALALALCAQWLAAGVTESVYHALRLTIAPASFTWIEQWLLFWLFERGIVSQSALDVLVAPLMQDFVGPQAVVWGWTIALFAIGFALAFLRWTVTLLSGAATARSGRIARTGFALYAISWVVFALMFTTAGRYMDIPLPHAILPLGGIVTLRVIAGLQPGVSPASCALSPPGNWLARSAAGMLLIAALLCLWSEAHAMRAGLDFVAMHPTLGEQIPLIARSILANHELLLWCASNVLLGAAFWFSARRTARVSTVAE